MTNKISSTFQSLNKSSPFPKQFHHFSSSYSTIILNREVLSDKKRIAIIGGGPSGLFMFKRLVESGNTNIIIDVFEKKQQLGTGMPYSADGANDEHVTNVSGNEIPSIVTPIAEWIKTVSTEITDRFQVDAKNFNDYKVLPRLLFGMYLSAQFDLLLEQAAKAGLTVNVHYESSVADVADNYNEVKVTIANGKHHDFDRVIICTGHNWPIKHEGKIRGFFDSPYPPSKLALKLNHAVAIRGSSLTAVDAIRTLAKYNGDFFRHNNGRLTYHLADDSRGFKMVMHTRNGMLPAVRFHLDNSHLENDSLLTADELKEHIAANGGFLSLDFIFENDFKQIIKQKDTEFYGRIKDMNVEAFVDAMMDLREHVDPFQLLKAEYTEAEKSIKRRESIFWKEMLGVLSFAMNYPAKHFSAEDMQRLQKVLIPLISIVIAYIPQSSAEQILALHAAGVLEMVPVGEDSHVDAEPQGGATYHYADKANKQQSVYFKTYIDCVGQPHLSYKDFPFKSMLAKQTISPARLKFRSAEIGAAELSKGNEKIEKDADGTYYLQVSGITISDSFQVVDQYGACNNRLYIMAVPYIGGYNPDYSGLDFCEEASGIIIKNIFADDDSNK